VRVARLQLKINVLSRISVLCALEIWLENLDRFFWDDEPTCVGEYCNSRETLRTTRKVLTFVTIAKRYGIKYCGVRWNVIFFNFSTWVCVSVLHFLSNSSVKNIQTEKNKMFALRVLTSRYSILTRFTHWNAIVIRLELFLILVLNILVRADYLVVYHRMYSKIPYWKNSETVKDKKFVICA